MRKKLTLIVVDDNPAAIDLLTGLLGRFVNLVVKASFTDSRKALAYLGRNHVDFVILDMEMPGVDGEAFLLQMPKAIKVILCTGFPQYATNGYDIGVVDFLLKPVTLNRLALAIDRISNVMKEPLNSNRRLGNNYYYFMLKGPKKSMRTKINFDELVYVEARKDGSSFFLIDNLLVENERRRRLKRLGKRDDGENAYGGIPTNEKLYELMEIFEGTSFIQIHRSFILNTDYFGRYISRNVILKGMEELTLPTGGRVNFPEFYGWMDNDRLPERE